jgi:hypothetical protein
MIATGVRLLEETIGTAESLGLWGGGLMHVELARMMSALFKHHICWGTPESPQVARTDAQLLSLTLQTRKRHEHEQLT